MKGGGVHKVTEQERERERERERECVHACVCVCVCVQKTPNYTQIFIKQHIYITALETHQWYTFLFSSPFLLQIKFANHWKPFFLKNTLY